MKKYNNNSSSKDDVIDKYIFYEYDNKCFTDHQTGLSLIYCFNYFSLEDDELNCILSPLNI